MKVSKLCTCLFVLKLVAYELLSKWDQKLSKCEGIEIRELDINDVHALYIERKLTSSELTKCYLKRISQMNPYLNAIIEVNPDALKIANEIDRKFQVKSELSGVLHGVPILLKDNIDTNDKMNTTAGSFALLESKPKEDAKVVTLLRKAGAIILGKTNLSEFSGFKSFDAPFGWSSRGGQTKNPYNLTSSPGGSSSGSAVAVAANLALVSLGTDTDGSIIGPSAVCLVVGVKPSVGSVSSTGIVPSAPSQDSVGVISRSVMDSLAVLYAISKPTLRASLDLIFKFDSKKSIISLSDDKKKFRVGIIQVPCLGNVHLPREQLLALNNMIEYMQNSGIEVRNVLMNVSLLSPEKVGNVLATEFKFFLNRYLKKRASNNPASNIRSLTDIINYNKRLPTDSKPYDQAGLVMAQNTTSINSSSYQYDCKENKRIALEAILKTIFGFNLDAIIVPSHFDMYGYIPSSIVGFPIINIPVGIGLDNTPFGFSVYSIKESESTLIQIALIISKNFKRTAPGFINV